LTVALTATRYQLIASVSLVALIALCLVWEGWLAPLRPGGSWLILKAVFLLPPLFGIFRGKRYTYKWLSLFIQFYLLEGALARHQRCRHVAMAGDGRNIACRHYLCDNDTLHPGDARTTNRKVGPAKLRRPFDEA
jgi:hypothetical protein